MDETFLFSNIVPQNAQNNKGIWLKVEKFCRKLARKYSNVYVISGPLYLATEREDGKKIVRYEVRSIYNLFTRIFQSFTLT